MRLCPIASGSSGNCIYVGSDTTHLLVDAGISGKRTEEALNKLELAGKDIQGILISHEHSDHIKGLGVLARKWNVPIYATEQTIAAVSKSKEVGNIDSSLFHLIQKDHSFFVGDLKVSPMHISHDAVDPVAFRVAYGSKKVGICTDLGYYDDYTVDCLQGMNALLLEANHDVRMLQMGPYTYALKMRILGDRGHLSNENSGKLLCRILHDDLSHVFLGHLSHENNHPELAYEAVRMEILFGKKEFADQIPLSVARRDEMSEVIVV